MIRITQVSVLSLLIFCNIAPAIRSQELRDAPTRAAFEFSTQYSQGYAFIDGKYRRFNETMKLTCYDNTNREYVSYLIPGSSVQPIMMETFVILDMTAAQCRPTWTLSFRGEVGQEVYYRIISVTEYHGDMELFDPQ